MEAADMTSKQRIETLRAQLANADRSGAGKPFPDHLRRAVIDFAKGAMASGESVEAAASALGISAMSIKRWTQRYETPSPDRAQLRRVEVVADHQRPVVMRSDSALVVYTAAGLRIEGLTLVGLAALVRAVG